MTSKAQAAHVKPSRRTQRGLTLIETAIVMVISGLVLAMAVKAQELIQGSRVRALIAQQSDIGAPSLRSTTGMGRYQGTIVPPARTSIVGLGVA